MYAVNMLGWNEFEALSAIDKAVFHTKLDKKLIYGFLS